MKCILLAAGYATRLYPLTKHTPKPLLPVAGRPVLDHILDQVETVPEVDAITVVTNAQFFEAFKAWLVRSARSRHIEILNDGTTTPGKRLGAIGDLALVIARARIDDDVLVLAGDNLFEFSLARFVGFFLEKGGTAAVTLRREDDPEKLRRSGVAVLDPQARITLFEEKPAQPRSPYLAPAFYLYGRGVLPLIPRYLEEKNNPDAPGHLVAWLHSRIPVYGFVFEEMRYDIGDLETYRDVDRIYSERAGRGEETPHRRP
ncbi:MAG: nucleotidyltransferase family protein [Planctomycetes bacterium]|nr:nucleotidyltransferase family protein [Planctomycetota bacterium]